jgi:hypothetical protein
VAVSGTAQSPAARFDVASVKENTSVSDTGGIAPATPGRVRITNMPLRFILLDAFRLMDHQLIGAPEWTESARFDINATYQADGARTEDDARAMLRTLLADRFGLKTHREDAESCPSTRSSWLAKTARWARGWFGQRSIAISGSPRSVRRWAPAVQSGCAGGRGRCV